MGVYTPDSNRVVLRQFSAMELAMAKMSSNIDFLAMMQDVEL